MADDDHPVAPVASMEPAPTAVCSFPFHLMRPFSFDSKYTKTALARSAVVHVVESSEI